MLLIDDDFDKLVFHPEQKKQRREIFRVCRTRIRPRAMFQLWMRNVGQWSCPFFVFSDALFRSEGEFCSVATRCWFKRSKTRRPSKIFISRPHHA